MTAKQRNQLAMFVATKHVFETYPDELISIPAFENIINEFNLTGV